MFEVKKRGNFLLVAYRASATVLLFTVAVFLVCFIGAAESRMTDAVFGFDNYPAVMTELSADDTAIGNASIAIPDFMTETEAPETDPPPQIIDDIALEPVSEELYRFSNQMKESERVDAGFYKNALFIGDSRTVGFCNFTSITDYCCAKVSLNVRSILTQTYIEDHSEEYGYRNVTIFEYVKNHADEFSRVYICFGINETGWNDSVFIACYETLIQKLREYIPDTPIYIQTILPVNEKLAAKYQYSVSNEIAIRKNGLLAQMCQAMGLGLINPAEAFVENDIFVLRDEYANDGVHLGYEAAGILKEYYLTHT